MAHCVDSGLPPVWRPRMSESLEPPPPRPPVWTVFKHRNYRLFFIGQILSLLGEWMQNIGQAWLVWRLTGTPLGPAVISFLQQGPVFFLSVLGGTLADRFDKRMLVMAMQGLFMVLAALLALLTFSGLVEIWHVAALAFAKGLGNALEIPSRQSLTVELVGREDLQSAVAANSMLFNIARVAGPALAGALIAAAGEAWCFALNAVSFLGVLIGLWLMTLPKFKPPPSKSPRTELVEGFRYVMRHRGIRNALLALALSSFCGGPYLTLMPVFAADTLHAGSTGFGFLMTAVGAGAFMGALAMSFLDERRLAHAPALAAIGFGVFLTAFSLSETYWLAFALILPTAFSLMLQGSSTNVIVQTLVEDRMRGRVMAYYTMSFLGMLPIGSLVFGGLAHVTSVPLALCAGGMLCALGGLMVFRLKRST